MPKSESQKLWQHAHPKKQKQYFQQYLLDKARILITIGQEDAEAIDKIKDPDESRAAWVKRLVITAIANSKKP